MKTFKLIFRNTSNNVDFVLIDSINEGEAIDLFLNNGGIAESMMGIENVTNKNIKFN